MRREQKTSFGNDFASFLLDVPNTVGRDVNVGSGSWRQTLYFAYAQDTLAGDAQFDADLRSCAGSSIRQRILIARAAFRNTIRRTIRCTYPATAAVPNDLGLPVRWTNFEPRVGAAYRASARTVVRAGFGISHTPFQDNNYAFNYPVRQNVSFNSTSSYLPAVRTDGSIATLENGFPPAPVASDSGQRNYSECAAELGLEHREPELQRPLRDELQRGAAAGFWPRMGGGFCVCGQRGAARSGVLQHQRRRGGGRGLRRASRNMRHSAGRRPPTSWPMEPTATTTACR